MSACIIPVAPEFQDPAASPNYAPYIQTATPDFGLIVTPPQLTFSITATDPNLEDDLHIRWVADYPNPTQVANYRTLVEDQVIPHSINGEPSPIPSFTVDCVVDNLAATSDGNHRIEVIVADRAFVTNPPGDQLDKVEPPGLVARAFWFLEQLSCPSGAAQ